MTDPASPAPRSLGREVIEGLFTLVFGAVVQLLRCLAIVWLKISRAVSRSNLRRQAVRMGRGMAAAGVGNHLLLQKLTGLPADTRERETVLEELGTSGLETGVPLLGLEEEYRTGRLAYEAARRAERRHDETAAKIWPAGAIGWCALVGSYVLTLAAIVLLVAYLAPEWVPVSLARLVGKGPREPEPPPPARPSISVPGLTVTVKRAVVGRTQLEVGDGEVAVINNQLSLQLTLTISNTGPTPLSYRTWRGKFGGVRDEAGTVVDDRGNSLLRVVFKGNATPPGGVSSVVIPPGGSIEDLLEFGPPEPRVKSIELFLPGENVERKGETFRLAVTASAMELPESFK